MIMKPSIKLENIINWAGNDWDIIISNDWNGINSGVFFVKNTSWSIQFLLLCNQQDHLIGPGRLDTLYFNNRFPSKRLPFQYEQRAFHYLLNTPHWVLHTKPNTKYRYNKSESIKLNRHIGYVDYCVLNSYYLKHRPQFRVKL